MFFFYFAILIPHFAFSLQAAEPPITDLAFTPDQASVVTTSQRGIRVHSWPDLREQRTIQVGMPNLHSLAFSPDGKRLAVGGGHPAEEGAVELFAWPSGERIVRLEGHADSVRQVAWADDQRVVSASIDRTIRVWDVEQKEHILTLEGHSRSVDCLTVLNDGKTLVSAGADQSLRVWELASGELVRSLNQHTQPVTTTALNPAVSGRPMVASAANDRTIRFWQPTIGRMVRYVRLESAPRSLAWTNDGAHILAGCTDGRVRLVDPVNVRVTHEVPGLDGWVYALAIHPDDESVVIAGTDGQIRRIEIEGLEDIDGLEDDASANH